MRVVAWLLLLVSFSLGLVSAFVVAYFTFDAKPKQIIVDQRPTVKILVAEKEIPIGAEITADYVSFKDVPIPEIPNQAITNFMQIYRRRPAYPLTAGCPICEDLLLPKEDELDKSAKYLPAGSQVVSLEVGQLRIGNDVSEFELPLSHILSMGDCVDIRVLTQQKAEGEYIRRKNEILQAFAARNGIVAAGDLVLENINIYSIVSKQAESGGKQIQTVSLLLDNAQAEKLTAAAREGRLRIVPHQVQTKIEKDRKNKEQEVERQVGLSIMEETMPEKTIQPITEEPKQEEQAQTMPKQPVRLLDSGHRQNISSEPKTQSNPQTATSFDFQPIVSAENKEFGHPKGSAHVSFVTPQFNSNPIRNDSGSSVETKSGNTIHSEFIGNRNAFRPRQNSSKSVEIGLPSSESFDSAHISSVPIQRSTTYSPFSTERRLSEIQTMENMDEIELPQPRQLRTRFR